jgi:hypothetical protein
MSAIVAERSSGWLRSPVFDLNYIFGIAAVALAVGAFVHLRPELFYLVLLADLWLLGYHHVIATFTRLVFDAESFREHRSLVLGLPWLVVAAVGFLYAVFGVWSIVTVYFYWQWFHYTRQSYGISRIYARKSGATDELDSRLNSLVVYAVPVWGVLYRSYQSPDAFLMLPIKMLPVPFWLVVAAGIVAGLAFAAWAARQAAAYIRGELAIAPALYMLSHVAIFGVAYLGMRSVDAGWLVVNIWHNAQYILLVWMFNNNRFKKGVDAKHRFLSTISQTRFTHVYFAVCLAVTLLLYTALESSLTKVAAAAALASSLPLVLVAYQAINFHHYIVDSVIWKVRKPAIKKTLGIPAS